MIADVTVFGIFEDNTNKLTIHGYFGGAFGDII
jgi:hypothetical protein